MPIKSCGLTAAVATCLLLTACNDPLKNPPKPSTAPAGFTVTPADGAVVVSWTPVAGLLYWLFRAQDTTVSINNITSQTDGRVSSDISSPYIVSGLTNGLTYAFLMNATQDNGPAGPATPVLTAVPQQAGFSWAAGSSYSSQNQYAFQYGDNLYLSVGAGGTAYSSPDGVNWSIKVSGAPNDLYGITYTSSMSDVFVAVGAGGEIVTTPDTNTWTLQTSGTSNNLRAITTNGTYYVAIGDNGTVLTSTNAWQWSTQASGVSANLRAITNNNGTLIAVGDGGTILYSTNGWQWTQENANTSNNLYGVTYANSEYVAVGAAGTILTSPDGVNWTPQTPPTSQNLYSITWGSQFAVAGAAGTLLYSSNGSNWTAASSGTSADLYAVNFYLYRLLAIGQNGANTLSY